jgi:DNA-binding MarR family transcriptional regulator
MVPTGVQDQARAIATLLPALMRQLMAGEDDPAVELPLAQLRVCNVLYQGPRSMSTLSRELGVSLSAMTQIADRLERVRLVRRVAAGKDRRIRRLQLTRRGEQMMRVREDARIERVAAVLEHLPADARGDVLAALQVLLRASVAARGRDGAPKAHNFPLPTAKVLR